MPSKYFASAVSVACLIFALPATANAVSSAAAALKSVDASGAKFETIAYRRCRWSNGVRYCRRNQSMYGYYGPAYTSGPRFSVILGIQ